MTNKEIKEAAKLIPIFVQMCENELGEDEHTIKNPLTLKEYWKVEQLINKLNNLNNFVDTNIFR
jgi:hypothetical protein